ncbi:MAG: CoB--CoM heterodisulfide reductase iron-sulfur subunit B family protein [bacterium]
MEYVYYPGCTLYTKAKNLDDCARAAAERVGFTLREMPSWNCCGAIYNTASDDLAAMVGPVRNLAKASQLGDKLVTLCAACYNVLKRTQDYLDTQGNESVRERLLAFVDEPFEHRVEVVHYLDVLKRDIGHEALRAKVTKPLSGLKVASYYGCLMVRPKEVLSFDDPENPVVMDDLMGILGAEPVRFDFKAECCGGYLVVNRRDVAAAASKKIVDNARAYGAEAIVTTCPLCQYNLDKPAREVTVGLPVFYFTQLLGLAVGLDSSQLGLDYNGPGAEKFLKDKGLI